MSYLILLRHGESEYNKLGLWAGWTDTPLSLQGEKEAEECGRMIKNIEPDAQWNVFVSPLQRAQKTAAIAIEKSGLLVERWKIVPAITERDYGVYTGINKWEMKKKLGEDEFKKLRRSFDYPIEKGESLKQVYERVVPWYQEVIEPLLQQNKDILLVAHGNSLRALVKYISNIDDNAIADFELATGAPYIYKNNTGILTVVKSV